MRNNWMDLPDYIKMCSKLGAYASFHKVTSPQNLSLKTWDQQNLQEVNDFLQSHQFKGKTDLEKINADHYQQYCNLIALWLKNIKDNNTSSLDFSSESISELKERLHNDMIKALHSIDIEIDKKSSIELKIFNIINAIPQNTSKSVYLKMLRTPAIEYIDKFVHLSEEELKGKFKQYY